jgi:hypothetical protein
MPRRGDSSSSQDSETQKQTEKQGKDFTRRSIELHRSIADSYSNNYYIDKEKAKEYRQIVRESFKNLTLNRYKAYKDNLSNVEGNSNQEILEAKSQISKNYENQQKSLRRLFQNLDNDLKKRSQE